MKRKWQHAAFALALAGVAILVPRSASARQTQPAYSRQDRAKMGQEVRQEKRQVRQQHGNVRVGRSLLRTSRRQYATGSQRALILRSDIHQAKRNAKAMRREKNQQFHLRRRQVVHKKK